MSISTNSIEREAMAFALKAHGDQKYGDRPYIYHLYNVVQILTPLGDSDLIQAAWLHDVIEDTTCNYSDLKKAFGSNVAELVYSVTDELGRNRRERKAKTWPKLEGKPKSLNLKLADMVANVEHAAIKHTIDMEGSYVGLVKNASMLKMYKKEYPAFREFFKKDRDEFAPGGTLWARLDANLK